MTNCIHYWFNHQQASEPNADEIDMPKHQHRDLQACTLGTYTGCSTGGAAGKILQSSSIMQHA
jgi:hypothetical protein